MTRIIWDFINQKLILPYLDVDLKYYDSIGYLLSLVSKNSKLEYKKNFSLKIKIWDNLIIFSRIIDLLIFNRFGKSLMIKCIKK